MQFHKQNGESQGIRGVNGPENRYKIKFYALVQFKA